MKILDHLNNRKKMVFQMTIVVVLCFAWFWLLKNHSVQQATYTDECVYMAQAHHLAKSSTLFSNFYMYESLLEQKPPLMPARHIAYISILGTIYKVFGFHEEFYLYLNFFLLFIFLYCLFQFGAKKLELAGRSWLAVLLFASFPLTNFLARLSMADILVIVSFFLLIWLMFFYEPAGQMKRWYPLAVVLFFWFCYLSRQTAIFILPVFLIWVCVKQGWKKAVCYGVLFLLSHFLIYWFIERWTARFLFVPYEVFYRYIKQGEFHLAVSFIFQNISNNIRLLFLEWQPVKFGLTKAAFWLIVIGGALSYPFLSLNGKKLYRIIMAIFVFQYSAMVIIFKASDWTGIRMMACTIPFFMLMIIQAAFQISIKKQTQRMVFHALIGLIVLFSVLSVFVVRESYAYLQNLSASQNVSKMILERILPKDQKIVVLSKLYDYKRMSIDFPNTVPIYMFQRIFVLEEEIQKMSRNFQFPDWIILSYGEDIIVVHQGKTQKYRLADFFSAERSMTW